MRGLYAIVDLDVLEKRGLDPVAFAAAILGGRPCALQLRAKNAPDARVIELLRALGPLCAEAGVPLVANDRPDLALVASADWVHVGQTDASPALVRALAPKLPFGVSTHTPEQLNAALHVRPTYVAFGPVWSTSSKLLADPVVGPSGLKQAARLLRIFEREHGAAPPLVAIGGVTLDRVAEIAGWVAAVAVISDLVPPAELSGDAAYDYARTRAMQFDAAFEDPVRLSDPSLIAPQRGS